MSRSLPEFQQYQISFTRHVRDPKANPRPGGVPARRMRVYNELLFNNIFSVVSACFPVARSVLGARKWKALLREFFSQHRCRTPYFRQLPEEFLQFMQQRGALGDEPDFLIHLLHYEWVELALDTSNKEADSDEIDPEGDLLTGHPILSPPHMLLAYPYAVHRIGKRYRPSLQQREETYLLVFRDQHDRVRFIVLNPVSARLVGLLETGKMSGNKAIAQVIGEMRHPDPDVAIAGGRAILDSLRREGAVVGTLRSRPGRAAL